MAGDDEQATEVRPVAAEPRFHARTAGIVAGAFVLLIAAFLAGRAVGGDDDGRDGRFEHRADRGAMPFGGGQQGRGQQGGRGPMGGGQMGRGPMGGGGERMRGGGPMGGGGGAMGVVEAIDGDTLTIMPLRGGSEAVEVTLTDDTTVTTRGDAGPQDVEEASIDDVDEGDVVMVRAERDDETSTAKRVMILHDAGE